MIIVTHEMEFAKHVANRVFYMDQGGIYEEGTAEEIFEHPQRTNTRRFVRALRALEFDVDSKDFDFLGSQTLIADFAYKNNMPKNLEEKLLAIMEELYQMIIIQPEEQNKMHVSFEYNAVEKSLTGLVPFTGPKFDMTDPMYMFSWPIIAHKAYKAEVEDAHMDGFTNKVILKIAND